MHPYKCEICATQSDFTLGFSLKIDFDHQNNTLMESASRVFIKLIVMYSFMFFEKNFVNAKPH